MSIAIRLIPNILMDDLFDGRLRKYGVEEDIVEGRTTARARCLFDGESSLWVNPGDEDAHVSVLVIYGFNTPGKVLGAIEREFNTKCFTEYEPEYWGHDTQDEWDADWRRLDLIG